MRCGHAPLWPATLYNPATSDYTEVFGCDQEGNSWKVKVFVMHWFLTARRITSPVLSGGAGDPCGWGERTGFSFFIFSCFRPLFLQVFN